MVNIWRLESKNQDGQLAFDHASYSLDKGSQELPAGVYTTFRTYHHDRVFRLQMHFDRLATSAGLQDVHSRLDQENIRKGIREIALSYPDEDIRFRIHWSIKLPDPVVYLMDEEFHSIPDEMYDSGVAAQTVQFSRENPLSKATSFINDTRELRDSRPANIHEYLLVGKEGEILEGMTSNVFCLMNGTLFTASNGILPGITRQLVLEAAENLSVSVVHHGLSLIDIHNVDEIFISSASRGVLPVTVLDKKIVGSGKPGLLTLKISDEFNNRLESELETI